LAQAMVALGNECGVNTRALLTNMDTPLGRTAGNWLEVMEAVSCLDPPGAPASLPATSPQTKQSANSALEPGGAYLPLPFLRAEGRGEGSVPSDLRLSLRENC